MILTITKYYFDEIASGRKKIEYRKNISYYRKKFKKPVPFISFHYRKKIYLDCMIKKITKIKRPKKLANSIFVTTPYCYAIHVESFRIRNEK